MAQRRFGKKKRKAHSQQVYARICFCLETGSMKGEVCRGICFSCAHSWFHQLPVAEDQGSKRTFYTVQQHHSVATGQVTSHEAVSANATPSSIGPESLVLQMFSTFNLILNHWPCSLKVWGDEILEHQHVRSTVFKQNQFRGEECLAF